MKTWETGVDWFPGRCPAACRASSACVISDDPVEVQQSKSTMRLAGLLGAEGTSEADNGSRASPQTLLAEVSMRFAAPKSYLSD